MHFVLQSAATLVPRARALSLIISTLFVRYWFFSISRLFGVCVFVLCPRARCAIFFANDDGGAMVRSVCAMLVVARCNAHAKLLSD